MSNSYRPLYHFTPPLHWMNDPNGLVYYDGEYHLFYQYHPASDVWGPMHWGHAVSRDLVNWHHLPIALYPDEHGTIFSGSAVVDKNNTAGFGKNALIAIFTHHRENSESQSLAYSNDAGRTWTKYSGNPILTAPSDISDFRDPKVFWYGEEDSGHWVMCLAVRNKISFYTSPDLIHWSGSGEFGPGVGSTEGVWETPELFGLPVEGGAETRWVLTVGVGSGALFGGSGTQYFIGRFDGESFVSENPKDTVLWADYGADFYAVQSWNDEPSGRRLMIAWMNNWQYALFTPSTDQRGALSIVREISLIQTEEGIRLIQKPISELQKLRAKHFHWQEEVIKPDTNLLADIHGESLEIEAEFKITDKVYCFGFRVHAGKDERTTISYNVKVERLYVDRTNSGSVDFKEGFARLDFAPLSSDNDIIRLHIYVDRSSVEVFVNDGLLTFTECVFPTEVSHGVELFAEGGEAVINSLDVYQLNPAVSEIAEN